MENAYPTLGDYSKPIHEGCKNTIELPKGNNVYSFESDTNPVGCKTDAHIPHGLLVRDPNQHHQDFFLNFYNALKRLSAGSITTWEDLTTRFLAQFFLPGRTAKLHNDILMFQQHHGESLSEAWTHFKDLLQKNDLRDLAKPVKAINLPQDVPVKSRLPGPQDTQYYIEDLEQAFVEYASSHTDETGEVLVSNFMASQDARLSKFEADFKQQQSEMTNKIDTVLKAIIDQITGRLPSDTELFLREDATRAIPNMGFNLVDVEGVWFGFFLQMGFTLILATLDGLDVGLLGDVIGGDDCDDDE
ncbi:zinc finger, CCHC-type containing protein [Tanacetum coccineum]